MATWFTRNILNGNFALVWFLFMCAYIGGVLWGHVGDYPDANDQFTATDVFVAMALYIAFYITGVTRGRGKNHKDYVKFRDMCREEVEASIALAKESLKLGQTIIDKHAAKKPPA